jgi:hypothetical protein
VVFTLSCISFEENQNNILVVVNVLKNNWCRTEKGDGCTVVLMINY